MDASKVSDTPATMAPPKLSTIQPQTWNFPNGYSKTNKPQGHIEKPKPKFEKFGTGKRLLPEPEPKPAKPAVPSRPPPLTPQERATKKAAWGAGRPAFLEREAKRAEIKHSHDAYLVREQRRREKAAKEKAEKDARDAYWASVDETIEEHKRTGKKGKKIYLQ